MKDGKINITLRLNPSGSSGKGGQRKIWEEMITASRNLQ